MWRLIILTVLVTLSSACVTLLDTAPVTDESHEQWSFRQQQLASVTDWSIRGRVVLFVDDGVYNLGLSWTRNRDLSLIKLEAPLGQGMIRLEQTRSSVILTTSEGNTFIGRNAQQVLQQSTGWSIPIEGLQSWIKGINHPRSNYLPDIDSLGRAKSLLQDDWQINYLQYETVQLNQYGNPVLPRKIYMKRQDLALKIVIDQWQPLDPPSPSELFPAFPE